MHIGDAVGVIAWISITFLPCYVRSMLSKYFSVCTTL